MTVTLYKLTDADGYTRRGKSGETLWQLGVPSPVLTGAELCRPNIWHAYESPLIASLIDPAHGDYGPTARLWRCEAPDVVVRDGWRECGVRQITPIEELPLLLLTPTVRVRIAIMLSMRGYSAPPYWGWAERWLNGADRSYDAAVRARAAAAAAAWAVRAAAAEAAAAAAWAARAAGAEAEAEAEAARAWASQARAWASREAAWAAREAGAEAAAEDIDALIRDAIRAETARG